MDVLEKALTMLEKRPLCDHCLGRQFALLGYGIENDSRGKALKLALTLHANALFTSKESEGVKKLGVLAVNGFCREAQSTLEHLRKRIIRKSNPVTCFLCEDKFKLVESLVEQALVAVESYEYSTFLVGIELPVTVEEREDEFKAAFEVAYGESIRHEFGRLLGKTIAERANKEVEYKKPEVVVVINPFVGQIRVQVNPLFVRGRYRKLVKGYTAVKVVLLRLSRKRLRKV